MGKQANQVLKSIWFAIIGLILQLFLTMNSPTDLKELDYDTQKASPLKYMG